MAKEVRGRWERGLEQEHQSVPEQRHVFVLSRAIIVTFSHFNGKDHGIKLPPSAEADLFWRAGTGSEFTACYVSHTKQRTWASALTASAV